MKRQPAVWSTSEILTFATRESVPLTAQVTVCVEPPRPGDLRRWVTQRRMDRTGENGDLGLRRGNAAARARLSRT